MATESDVLCFVTHRNMRLRYRVQALKDPPLSYVSATIYSLLPTPVLSYWIWCNTTAAADEWWPRNLPYAIYYTVQVKCTFTVLALRFTVFYVYKSLFGYRNNNTIHLEFAPFSKNMIKFVSPDSYNSQILKLRARKRLWVLFYTMFFLYSSISFSIEYCRIKIEV